MHKEIEKLIVEETKIYENLPAVKRKSEQGKDMREAIYNLEITLAHMFALYEHLEPAKGEESTNV